MSLANSLYSNSTSAFLPSKDHLRKLSSSPRQEWSSECMFATNATQVAVARNSKIQTNPVGIPKLLGLRTSGWVSQIYQTFVGVAFEYIEGVCIGFFTVEYAAWMQS